MRKRSRNTYVVHEVGTRRKFIRKKKPVYIGVGVYKVSGPTKSAALKRAKTGRPQYMEPPKIKKHWFSI